MAERDVCGFSTPDTPACGHVSAIAGRYDQDGTGQLIQALKG